MSNVKISALPTWSGTSADSRWFVMNNQGETETFKFNGFTTPIKYMTGTNRIQNVSDVSAKVNGDDQTNIGGKDNNIQSTNVRCYIFGGYENTITTKALGFGSMIVGGGGNTIGGSSDATANFGGSIFGCNTAENNAYYSAIIGTYAPLGLYSKIRRGVDSNNGIAGAFIGGGYGGEISVVGLQSYLIGGFSNIVQSQSSGVIGGTNNSITSNDTSYDSTKGRAVIVGGSGNTITNINQAFIIGSKTCTINNASGGITPTNNGLLGSLESTINGGNRVIGLGLSGRTFGAGRTGFTAVENLFVYGQIDQQEEAYDGSNTTVDINIRDTGLVTLVATGGTYNIDIQPATSNVGLELTLMINYYSAATINFVSAGSTQWKWGNGESAPTFSGNNNYNILVFRSWDGNDLYEQSRSLWMS